MSEDLHWTIPLFWSKTAKEFPELNTFMADIWRFELKNKSFFTPIHTKSKKPMFFNMEKFFVQHVKRLKSDYNLYLGSKTTPPCIGKLYKFELTLNHTTKK